MPAGFSIITAVYNGSATIRDCLASVASQTHPCEHIIIDGGSTDGTLEIVRECPSTACVVSEPDRGPYDAMNKGIRLATGDVIGILNADDFYSDDNVLTMVAEVFDRDHFDSCYGDLVYVYYKYPTRMRRYWRSRPYNENLFYRGWMPPHPTFFVRKAIYERLGGFNVDLGTAADYELMLRFLLKHKITTTYIPKTLVKMRIGGLSNSSIGRRLRANSMDRLAWEINGLRPLPWTLHLKPFSKIGQWLYPCLHGNRC